MIHTRSSGMHAHALGRVVCGIHWRMASTPCAAWQRFTYGRGWLGCHLGQFDGDLVRLLSLVQRLLHHQHHHQHHHRFLDCMCLCTQMTCRVVGELEVHHVVCPLRITLRSQQHTRAHTIEYTANLTYSLQMTYAPSTSPTTAAPPGRGCPGSRSCCFPTPHDAAIP